MTTLRTRASKGSELTHGELDANFSHDVDVKTTTYAALVSDNRTTLECNHATVPFTVTLGDAATMAAAETGDYQITVHNIGAAAVTVARAGSDTIDGAATSIVLQQYSSVTLKVNAATDGYNVIAFSVSGAANLTAAEVATLDGLTSSTAELNIMDGVTASTADINATTNFEETISATTSEVTIATGKTLNIADDSGLKLNETAVSTTAANLNRVPDLLSSQTASADTEINFTSYLSATYTKYKLELIDIILSTDFPLLIRFSTDGGSTYISTNTYQEAAVRIDASSTSVVGTATTAASSGGLADGLSPEGSSDTPFNSTIIFNNLNTTGIIKSYRYESVYHKNTSKEIVRVTGAVSNNGVTDPVDAIQVLKASGTFSGTLKLWGIE